MNSRTHNLQPKRAFDDLWEYNQPAETEQKFRAHLAEHAATMSDEERLELLTQIARTQGLQFRLTLLVTGCRPGQWTLPVIWPAPKPCTDPSTQNQVARRFS